MANLKSSISINAYEVIRRAVEAGTRYGLRRAYKHTETPDRDAIVDQIEQAIMSELSEVVNFFDDDGK